MTLTPGTPPRSTPRPSPGDELVVRIDRLAYGGEAVARHEGLVVFTEKAAPGETVRVRVNRTKKRFVEAALISVEQPSPARVEPRCPHFVHDGCGGCRWQHLAYEAQLAEKQDIVRDSLERIGGYRDLAIAPIIPSPSPWYFRNKMEFAFQRDGGLGLHPRGFWDRIFRLETCFLESPLTVEIVKAARAFAEGRNISRYDPRERHGFLRELIVRQSQGTGETMIGIVTAPGPFPDGADMAAHLAALDPGITSVVRGIRSGPSDGSPLESTTVLRGAPTITEVVSGLRFKIALETFFQTSSAQAEAMVDVVRAQVGAVAGAFVLDVYCGVGLFALAMARDGAAVAGIEVVAPAIEAARENATANGLTASFHAGDARKVLPEVLAERGPPAVIVLDPPRGGAGGKVMRRLARAQPRRIVYVSCNPTTLARDLNELDPFGYRITAVQPLDLFPQTYHVETIVTLDLVAPAAPAVENGEPIG